MIIVFQVIKREKVSKADFERMVSEAELLQQLDHPNIVKYKHVRYHFLSRSNKITSPLFKWCHAASKKSNFSDYNNHSFVDQSNKRQAIFGHGVGNWWNSSRCHQGEIQSQLKIYRFRGKLPNERHFASCFIYAR